MNMPSDILKIRDSILYNENAKKDIRIASIGDTHISNILGAHDFIDEGKEGFPDVIDETTIWDEIDKIPNVHVLNDKTYSDDNIFIGGYRQKKDTYYNFYRERREDPKAYYRDFKKKENLYGQTALCYCSFIFLIFV